MSNELTAPSVIAHPSRDLASVSPLPPDSTLIRMSDLLAATGLARPTVYKLMKSDPAFPKPVKLCGGTARSAPVGFVLSEVRAWIRTRIEARAMQ